MGVRHRSKRFSEPGARRNKRADGYQCASRAEVPGFKLVSGASLAIIDLIDPDKMRARLHQNWRNQLKRAEISALRVIDQAIDPRKHQWFFEAEQAQQKARNIALIRANSSLPTRRPTTGRRVCIRQCWKGSLSQPCWCSGTADGDLSGRCHD